MEKQQIISAAQELVRAGRPFVLATVDQQGGPQMRWMGGAHLDEPMTVYLVAGAKSRKMGQIEAQSKSQLMFQTEDFSKVATLGGTCELVSDMETKRRVWDAISGASDHFSGPEDPNFAVIRIVCQRVEMLGVTEDMTPAVAEL